MKPTITTFAYLKTRLLLPAMVAVASLAPMAHAAAPGITGPTFNLTAQDAYLNQPDGSSVYSWGYGCNGVPAGFAPGAYTNSTELENANCTAMQVPGPTLIVTEGDTVTINLKNNLPAPAGRTSILFPGFQVCVGSVSSTGCAAISGNGVPGLLTQEAANGGTVTYSFIASQPGTHSYYSGTQGDLQVEMGLYGALIVRPKTVPSVCTSVVHATNVKAQGVWGEKDYRLSQAAYDNPNTCYDREYLFQFSEMDSNIHSAALAQVTRLTSPTGICVTAGPTSTSCKLDVPTEPYHPAFFLINGRSMPDDMDDNYGVQYPHQPYNGNPHAHPGEEVLLRIIGQGRWQHPFHEHANHVRILARDGNLILTPDGKALAGAPLFTTTTTPGQTMDGIFYYTGRGLNWDMYGHNPKSPDSLAILSCTPDSNGYNTGGNAYEQVNYFEWCQDHNKPLEAAPFGDVNSGGPATLPNPLILTNGNWYSGSPYLGPDATLRATTTLSTQGGAGSQTSQGCATGNPASTPNCSNLLPSNTQANPANERGFAFMWHSHNEREITTNNVFPGGMMMMLLVDSREFVIDESK
jgi:FtsP/CotA-like multicopper oxidase with cupredoxin domain